MCQVLLSVLSIKSLPLPGRICFTHDFTEAFLVHVHSAVWNPFGRHYFEPGVLMNYCFCRSIIYCSLVRTESSAWHMFTSVSVMCCVLCVWWYYQKWAFGLPKLTITLDHDRVLSLRMSDYQQLISRLEISSAIRNCMTLS